MNKIVIFFISIFVLTNTSFAQRITASEKKLLEKKEDSLKIFAQQIINGRNPEERFAADSQFTKTFVRALQIKNSFYYPFDSLVSIAKVIPADSSFKIFTWQLVIGPEVIRQHGAIQMKTADGSLKLFPLIDKTDLINNIDDTITSNRAWIGALYYRIIEEKSFGKNVYTLLGFDDNNLNSDRKFIEVLTFQNGEPVFGGPYFSFQDNSLKKKSVARYVMEYKKNAGPRLTYDNEMNIIIYEHLISETGEPQKKYTYIPDGDYEGLKWRDGKWVHIEKVFNQITPEGHEPVPNPILDEKGNIDESKLSNRMPENIEDSVDRNQQQNQLTPPSKKKKK
ncbi:MAG: hypothetical protein ACTHOB_05835 [Ginsengibacter sp.]|jgi:hypothetical protein